jgi:LuxR family maltose regulon positive regulatory protein
MERDRPFFAFIAELMLGLARYMAGNKASALGVLRERLQAVEAQDGQLRAYLLGPLAIIHLLAGDLTQARMEGERIQRVARKNHLPNAEGWGSYLEACAQLHAHQLESALNALVGAAAHRYALETRAAVDALAGLALIHQLMGRHERASDALGVLQAFAHETNDALTLSVAHSARARIALLRGDLPSALDWAQSLRETPLPMELFLWLEVPSITRARVLIAVGSEQSLAQATELLEELRKGSDALRLIGQTIEIAVLQVLVLERQGRTEEALTSLKETLALAVRRGWVRPFVEAGPAMLGILRRLDASGEEAIFVHQILDALERPVAAPTNQEVSIAEKTRARASQPLSCLDQQAVESLTNREIDVLELLAQRLQNKEIASRLCISPHTVNDHTRRIYDKLRVHGRRQAVKRAVELGLVDRGMSPA